MKQRRLFIAWAPHNRRSQLLAEKLNAELHLISRLKHRSPMHAPLKYPWMALDTWRLLRRTLPQIVFVQNPPPILPLVVWLFGLRHPLDLVIDHHSAAFGRSWSWMNAVQRFLVRRARLNIVTNKRWQSLIQGWDGEAVILDDVPAEFPQGTPYPLKGQSNIAVISSFAPDEPLDAIVGAAIELPGIQFYVTGDSRRAPRDLLATAPGNVTFTGFLPDSEYFGLLRGVDAVMVLTMRDHTNQRGACEAVWLGRPLITSDWPILRKLFSMGTVHVPNTSAGIKTGVQSALANGPALAGEMLQLQDARRASWQAVSKRLGAVLK
jgi:glycosyltransferase involved in cell wall biosynthesis